MGNQSRNGNNGVGCCIMNSLVETFGNLFSTQPFCGNGNCGNNNGNNRSNNFNNGFVSGVNAVSAANGLNTTNSGCGCGCGCNNNFRSGFSSGVNAANALLNDNNCNNNGNGNGCGCGCGSNADLSSYTACGNQCFDAYYAQQYGLYPFNQSGNGNGCGCGCGCSGGNIVF